MPSNVSFDDLLVSAQESALHLEMRDAYGLGDEAADFERWRSTGVRDVDPESAYWLRGFAASGTPRHGASPCAGLVSCPSRSANTSATSTLALSSTFTRGEDVRWLARRRASDLLLPGNDLWIFDGQTLLFNHFTGCGDWSDPPGFELCTEPDVVKQCAAAFDAVWERAVPHHQYTLR